MKRYCCDGWDENIEILNGPIILQSLRSGRNPYQGKPFTFCPWCGRTIDEQPQPGLPKAKEIA